MKIKIPLKLSSWNDIIGECRSNKYYANTHKKREMADISIFLNKIPKIEKYPVEMVFKWHIKRNCDLDNKSVKSLMDQMQIQGILENDDIKHINKITYIAIPDKEDYVEVEILNGNN